MHGRSGDLDAYLLADTIFHRTLLDASGNEMLRALHGVVAEVLSGRTHHGMMPSQPEPGGDRAARRGRPRRTARRRPGRRARDARDHRGGRRARSRRSRKPEPALAWPHGGVPGGAHTRRPHPRGADRGRPGRLPAARTTRARRAAPCRSRPSTVRRRSTGCGSSPTRAPGTAGRRPGRSPSAGRGSPTTWWTCWPSCTTSGSTSSSPWAGPAAGRGRWPAPRSFPAAAWRPRAWPAWRRTTSTISTGTKGWREENVEEFAAAVQGASTYHQFLRSQQGPEPDTTAADLVESLGGLLTPTDAAALTGEFADLPARVDPEGAASRAWSAGATTAWRSSGRGGSTSARSPSPTSIWHGRQDAMVPFAHGEWLARARPRRAIAPVRRPGTPLPVEPGRHDPRRAQGARGRLSVTGATPAARRGR